MSSVATFLDRASLELAMHEMLDQPPFSPSKCALAHIILALGAHILGSEGHGDIPKGSAYDPLDLFSASLKLKPQIMEKDFSVRNFQASLIL